MINCYLEIAPAQAKTFAAIVQSYGIADHLTIGSGKVRGGLAVNGVPYVVVGTKLYRIPETGAAIELGSIPGTGYVDMAGDETHVMLVTEGLGYYWDGTLVTRIVDEDFPGADWVETLDGYFIVGVPNSGRFAISSNRNPAAWDALDFASAERYPDDIVSGIVDHGELILLGKMSGEVFTDTGNADFPIEAVPNGIFEVGCLSRFGPGKIDNTIFFPGHDGIVYKLNGYKPERVSTHWIEQIIEGWPNKTCYGMTWVEGGHKFYGLSSSSGAVVYDISTGKWHERKSRGYDQWRPRFVLRAYDEWFVGDQFSNKLGKLDPDIFTEWNEILRSSAASASVSNDGERVRHFRLELIFEQGVGLITGQGSDPQVMLRWSDDGGRTWSNGHWRSLGRTGKYTARTIWNQLGWSRDRVYEYAISDPVRRTLILATTNVDIADRVDKAAAN
jgi:hypothetical protein